MMAKKGKKKGGMCRFWWIPAILISASMLAGCEYAHGWATANDPEPPPPDPGVPPASPLPHIGGTDPLDLVATVLAMLGLAPAARLVTMAKPFLASLILAVLGRKKPQQPQPPAAE